MTKATGFYAYPDNYLLVGPTIEGAVAEFNDRAADTNVTTWKEMHVAGRFIANEVLARISESDFFIADVSYLNFNVTFEVGYAIGRGKPILLTRMEAVGASKVDIDEVGIFDTIGYSKYNNQSDIKQLLVERPTALLPIAVPQNKRAPVYLIESKFQTDHITRLVSRIKKARLFFRSFDPAEQPRMSAPDAILQVAQSYGVLLHLLPASIDDAIVHNLRAAFLAGLAMGMERILTVLQLGHEPVPLDYRDFAKPYTHLDHIDRIVSEFAPAVVEAMQSDGSAQLPEPSSLLERLNIGTSSAENELKDLGHYFIKTDAFLSTKRGEVRLVAGRKGSGKTAVFAQIRDELP